MENPGDPGGGGLRFSWGSENPIGGVITCKIYQDHMDDNIMIWFKVIIVVIMVDVTELCISWSKNSAEIEKIRLIYY